MRARWVVGIALAALMAAAPRTATATPPTRSIVRIQAGINGWSRINLICTLLHCQIGGPLDTLPGQTAGSSLFLVYNLPNVTLPALFGIAAVEADLPVRLQFDESWGSDQATAGVLDQLWDRAPVGYYGTTAWQSYVTQPAADIVRVRDAHCLFSATGSVTVAVIDTGVDRSHPTLQPVLTDGYDFTREASGGEERADVDQATAGVLDGIYGVNQGTAAALDQATAGVLDDTQYSHFGHGTMVAGVIHLVAPTAQIMPLKAFSATGDGYTSDIIRAITYATQHGAKVLNMSFSRATPSEELRHAIDNAAAQGMIAVASAGNDGVSAPKYPAAYANVMSVASTADDDTRSTFSNYGSTVWVAAPGEGVITTYPWGSFAAAWGTSFSTPMVAGAAAMLAGMEGSTTFVRISNAIANAQYISPELGNGRLDLYQTVEAASANWPMPPSQPVPESCGTSGVDWSTEP